MMDTDEIINSVSEKGQETIKKGQEILKALKSDYTTKGPKDFFAAYKDKCLVFWNSGIRAKAIVVGSFLVVLVLIGVVFSGGKSEQVSTGDAQSGKSAEVARQDKEATRKKLDKILGAGMGTYLEEWAKAQIKFERMAKEFALEAQNGMTGSDFMIIVTKDIIPAAKDVMLYAKACPDESKLTTKGKKFAEVAKKIGTIEYEMWGEYRNAAFMGDVAQRRQALGRKGEVDKLMDQVKEVFDML